VIEDSAAHLLDSRSFAAAYQRNNRGPIAVQACQHLLGPNGVNGGASNNSALLAFAQQAAVR